MKDKPKRRIVELVKSDYQPSKAELEEEFQLDVPGDTVDQRMRNLARALLQQSKIRRINHPRKKTR